MTTAVLLESLYDYKAGEAIVKEEPNVQLTDPLGKAYVGNLVLTNYRLLFWSQQNAVCLLGKSQFYETPNTSAVGTNSAAGQGYGSGTAAAAKIELNLPLGLVQEFEKTDGSTLNIKCKDFRSVSLRIKSGNESGGERFHKHLERHLNPRSHGLRLFAFVHFEASQAKTLLAGSTTAAAAAAAAATGYNESVLSTEFQRQLIDMNTWKISKVNHNFEVCETYPVEIAVPKDVSDEQISNACQFRTKNRFPVLSWIHPDSKATLTRSSQPATGITWKRNDYDERFLKAINDANAYNNRLTIIDARPMINARANMARGGGIENQSFYTFISYEFLNIPNIHVMRESQRKLADLVHPRPPDNQAWHKALEETRWLSNIRQILLASLMVAEKINSQRSVLVHCSDGWDRTSQIVSLPELMLDPYFRTIKGFQTLVDKEWLLMGHKISQRTGGLSEESSSPSAPLATALASAGTGTGNGTAANPSSAGSTGSSGTMTASGDSSPPLQLAASAGGPVTATTGTGSSTSSVTTVPPPPPPPLLAVPTTTTTTNNPNPKSERAPIFLQFIDCVWQMTQQFVSAFEFNEQFLIELLDAVHSGLYGNFLFNSEQQRRQHDVYNKTFSFWSVVNADIARYRNPLYTSADESGHRVLFPQYRLPCIRFWSGYYLRHYLPSRKQDPIMEYNRVLSQRMKIFQTYLSRENEDDEEPTPSTAVLLGQTDAIQASRKVR